MYKKRQNNFKKVDMKTIRKILRILLKTIKWTLLIIFGLAIVSALYNLTLPKKSKTVEHLCGGTK